MNGMLCFDKPEGISSFAAVGIVRRLTGEKKCGHTGTLDPMATGVLPVLLGAATRFSDFLPSHDKAYRATLQLGQTSDTLDRTGTILTNSPVTATPADFERVLAEFVGEITQLPPMYSAVSVNGQRLYSLARQGIEVEREARRVTIYAASLMDCDAGTHSYTVDVSCSAGTYIRTLADDIGKKLGCGALLTALERTAANGFTKEQARCTLQLEQAKEGGRLQEEIRPIDSVLQAYPALTVSPAQAMRFFNGGALDLARLPQIGSSAAGLYRVYHPQGNFLGLGEIRKEELAVARVYTGAFTGAEI